MTSAAFQPSLLHRLWRLLPANGRRRAGTEAAALLAPRIDRSPPPAAHGIAVAGAELVLWPTAFTALTS